MKSQARVVCQSFEDDIAEAVHTHKPIQRRTTNRPQGKGYVCDQSELLALQARRLHSRVPCGWVEGEEVFLGFNLGLECRQLPSLHRSLKWVCLADFQFFVH